MFHTRFLARTAAVLAACAFLSPGLASAQEFKGQIKVGIHKVNLEAGKIYSVVLESKCPDPSFPFLEVYPDRLITTFGKSPREDMRFMIPTKSGEQTFQVVSALGPNLEPTVDYTLSIKVLAVNDKTILKEKVSINANDPIYPPLKARHKVYTVQLKANNFYIIDLVKTGGNQDPYLFLEDAQKMVVAQDDDSGGDLNARIIYHAMKDGDYRIIATTLNNTLGDMNLTVRMLTPIKK